MEVYWQLILRTGCARFAGHDTLPSRLATVKPRIDVLHRRTESNVAQPRSAPPLCRLPGRSCRGDSSVRSVDTDHPLRVQVFVS